MMSDMTLPTLVPNRSRPLGIALLIGRVVFGLLFLAAGLAKIYGPPMMVAEFDQVGLGQWFRYLTGALEIAGTLLLIRPATVSYGAGLLAVISLGALVAQVTVLHGDVIHAIVFAFILAVIAYVYLPDRRRLG